MKISIRRPVANAFRAAARGLRSVALWLERAGERISPLVQFPAAKRVLARPIAADLIEVKPMSAPLNTLHYFDLKGIRPSGEQIVLTQRRSAGEMSAAIDNITETAFPGPTKL
jgi:hypothetical protein